MCKRWWLYGADNDLHARSCTEEQGSEMSDRKYGGLQETKENQEN